MRPITIYNTLSRRKEPFVPLDPEGRRVNIYSCGVTVYDKCHIGHARSLYIFDVISRYLRHKGYDVRFVRNITDVDDKIIRKARETGKAFEEVVKENIALYQRDLRHLGVSEADAEPRATRNIEAMIQDIEALIAKGFAYVIDGNVYYRVRRFENYGRLSGQSVDQMLEATRIEQDPLKEDPLDFALWKAARPQEPFWESPWGRGRPGWHIECSCMSRRHLACETIDIHAGGKDLIFPHHENEIAQAEPVSGRPFAKYWIHHGLLTINGQKMAKSLGNFITLDEVLQKHPSSALKVFFLQSHYRRPVDFSWDKMAEAHKICDRIRGFFRKMPGQQRNGAVTREDLKDKEQRFYAAMDDDFNTPQGLAVLFDVMREGHKILGQGDSEGAGQAAQLAGRITDILGLKELRDTTSRTEEVSSEIRELLLRRQEARQRKDYATSDALRETLRQKGVIVEDGKDGQTWRRA